MTEQIVEALIDGGKATAAPPLGPALGPLGVNIGQIVADINRKTEGLKGMQVPVKVIVNLETKGYTITVGTPPTSALIKKEAGLDKGSSNPLQEMVADLRIEQIIKIAKMKEDSLFGRDFKSKVKIVVGTCCSMGVMVEGVRATETIKLIDQGKFDNEIRERKTEISKEELEEVERERQKLLKEIEEKRKDFEAKAKAIIASMEGKTRKEIKTKMVEAGIPQMIIDEMLPAEEKAAGEEKKGPPKEAEKKV